MVTLGNRTSSWGTMARSMSNNAVKNASARDIEDFVDSPGGIVLIIIVSLVILSAILVAIIVPIMCSRRKKQAASYQAMATPSGVVRKSRQPITAGAPVPVFASGPAHTPTVAPPTVEVANTVWVQPSNPTMQAQTLNSGQTAALFPPAATKVRS